MIISLYLVLFLSLLISVYLFILKLKETKKGKLNERITAYLKERGDLFSYDRIEVYLRKNGYPFELTPITYLFTKFLLTISLFFIFLTNGSPILGALFSVVGFFLNNIVIGLKNKEENRQILFELRDIYDTIIIQVESGVFIGDVLTQLYKIPKGKRLKKALARLSAEINMTGEIKPALKSFAEKFNSQDITNFVIVISQSLDSGQIKKELRDRSNEISHDISREINKGKKALENTMKRILLFILIGVIFTLVYVTWGDLGSGINSLTK